MRRGSIPRATQRVDEFIVATYRLCSHPSSEALDIEAHLLQQTRGSLATPTQDATDLRLAGADGRGNFTLRETALAGDFGRAQDASFDGWVIHA